MALRCFPLLPVVSCVGAMMMGERMGMVPIIFSILQQPREQASGLRLA